MSPARMWLPDTAKSEELKELLLQSTEELQMRLTAFVMAPPNTAHSDGREPAMYSRVMLFFVRSLSSVIQ